MRALGRSAAKLWSVWAGVAGLATFAAVWQVGHEIYGDFILPAPLDVGVACWRILSQSDNWATIGDTLYRALCGFALAASIGAAGGVAAGFFPAMFRLCRPILTFLIGVPPIAWMVIALIWFGTSDRTVIVTVAVACAPMAFVQAAEGVMTRDRKLAEMATAFAVSPLIRFLTIDLRHVVSFILPALIVSLGSAVKVVVMVELLSHIGGIGGELAMSRASLDITASLAWILTSVVGLIVMEYLLLYPIQARLNRWRQSPLLWGIKR